MLWRRKIINIYQRRLLVLRALFLPLPKKSLHMIYSASAFHFNLPFDENVNKKAELKVKKQPSRRWCSSSHERITSREKNNIAVCIVGGVGRGSTFLFCCLARIRKIRNKAAIFFLISVIGLEIRHCQSEIALWFPSQLRAPRTYIIHAFVIQRRNPC